MCASERRRCSIGKGYVMSLAFEPHRFRSTVPFYAAYRVPYPDALIVFVAERCNLAHASPVLDLGCGPGQLAVAFARLGCAVTAMDAGYVGRRRQTGNGKWGGSQSG